MTSTGTWATLQQTSIRVPIHYVMAVLGLFAFATSGGMLGVVEPFWWGGKGMFVPLIGSALLLLETLVFFVSLQYSKGLAHSTNIVVAFAAFIGGFVLTPMVFGSLAVLNALQSSSFSGQLNVAFLVAAVICGLLTSVLTRALSSSKNSDA